MVLRLKEKTGFRTLTNEVTILKNGRLFYHFQKQRPGWSFNLPAGEYTTDSAIHVISKPVRFKYPRLPKPEKKAELPRASKLKIKIGINRNKASIWTQLNSILIDRSIADNPYYVLVYVFLHEIGHYYYKTEWKADLFSCVTMLQKGFNPSQVFRASRETLSKNSYKRIEKMFNNLKDNKNA